MNWDKQYAEIAQTLSNKVCHTWPEQAFISALWSDLATNIESVYKARKASSKNISQAVKIGYMDATKEGMGLALCEDATELKIPLLFNWCA